VRFLVTSLATLLRPFISGPEAVRLLQPNALQPITLSPSIHTGWVVSSRNRTPNLTFNTSGSPADATSYAATQLEASVGEPEVLKVRLGVRFPLATTHPI